MDSNDNPDDLDIGNEFEEISKTIKPTLIDNDLPRSHIYIRNKFPEMKGFLEPFENINGIRHCVPFHNVKKL